MALVTEPLALTICGSIIHLHPFPLPDKTYGVVRQEEAGALRAADRRDERLVLRLVLAAVADTEEVLAVDEVLPAGGRGPQAGHRDGQAGGDCQVPVCVADGHGVRLLRSVGRPHLARGEGYCR